MLPSTNSLIGNEENPVLREIRNLQKRMQQLESRAAVRSSMATAASVNVIAGEGSPFNDEDPFTGSALLYPAFAHSTGNYHIIGMNGGTLQFGLSADDGKAYAGGGNIVLSDEGIQLANSSSSWFRFEDAGGTFDKVTIACDPNNDFEFTNLTRSPNGTISFFIKDTAATTRLAVQILEDPVNANTVQLNVNPQSASAKFSIGSEVVLWAALDGKETIFNEGSYDIDFRIESATNINFFKIDAGAEKLFIGGRTEIRDASHTAIHILDTTGAVYFNENNGDVDFIVEGDTDGNLFRVDAGLDAIGMGRAAQASYKLSIEGTLWTDSIVVNAGGADEDWAFYDTSTHLLYGDVSASRVGIGTNAPGSKLDVAGSFQCNSITNDTGLAAANYSPGLHNTTNVAASTLNGAQYIRLGNWVLVFGSVDIDPTSAAGTVTVLGIDLPIASNFTTAYDASGGGSERVSVQVGNVGSDSTNDRALLTFSATDAANRTWRFWFMYEVK